MVCPVLQSDMQLSHQPSVIYCVALCTISCSKLLILPFPWGDVCPVLSGAGSPAGTFIAGRLARLHRKRVHSLCLIDPVCFGMFMPQLLSNFLYNAPEWKGLHQ